MTMTVKGLDRMAKAAYNIDYPTWESKFVKAGGTKRMAKHTWHKWKDVWHDNWLYAFGNWDRRVQIHAAKALLMYADQRGY